jgi:hypothetical protein
MHTCVRVLTVMELISLFKRYILCSQSVISVPSRHTPVPQSRIKIKCIKFNVKVKSSYKIIYFLSNHHEIIIFMYSNKLTSKWHFFQETLLTQNQAANKHVGIHHIWCQNMSKFFKLEWKQKINNLSDNLTIILIRQFQVKIKKSHNCWETFNVLLIKKLKFLWQFFKVCRIMLMQSILYLCCWCCVYCCTPLLLRNGSYQTNLFVIYNWVEDLESNWVKLH